MKATLFWWVVHIYSIVYWRVVLFLWHFGYLVWKMWNKYGYFGYYGRFLVTHGHNLALSRCVQAQKKSVCSLWDTAVVPDVWFSQTWNQAWLESWKHLEVERYNECMLSVYYINRCMDGWTNSFKRKKKINIPEPHLTLTLGYLPSKMGWPTLKTSPN